MGTTTNGGMFLARTQLLRDDGPEAGELQGRIRAMACQSLNSALRMVSFLRLHGADDRQLVHVLGDLGKDLGDLDARGIGRDGLEAAVALYVPGVQMADAALEPQ